jgi:hypothetical protein
MTQDTYLWTDILYRSHDRKSMKVLKTVHNA